MVFTAKTVEEATAMGLKELGLTTETAQINVIEEPVKGLFGKLKGKAIIDISPKEETNTVKSKTKKSAEKDVEKKQEKKTSKSKTEVKDKDTPDIKKAKEFLTKVLEIMEIDAQVEITDNKENDTLTLITDNSSKVIGYRGEVLDAMQVLAGAVANINNTTYKKVVVDCENYRDRREETLIKLAKKLEAKAVEMKREVMIEPMSAFERRIIHTALADSDKVTTRSDGTEPNRYVVIVPNEKDEYAKPYNAGRNNYNGYKGDGKKHGNGHGKNGKNFSGKKPMHQNGFSETKKKTSMSFGTYLGNSLKDKD